MRYVFLVRASQKCIISAMQVGVAGLHKSILWQTSPHLQRHHGARRDISKMDLVLVSSGRVAVGIKFHTGRRQPLS